MAEAVTTIHIHRFFTKFRPSKTNPGETEGVDYVEYGPLGNRDRSRIVARVKDLAKIEKNRAHPNPGVAMAAQRWAEIEPKYRAWKAGHEVVEEGTPLAAFNAIDHDQAEQLRMNGIHTVETLAKLSDSHVHRFRLPGLVNIVRMAQNFVDAKDNAAFQLALEEKDKELSGLKAEMDELREIVKDLRTKPAPEPDDEPKLDAAPRPRRRGRPPKTETVKDEPANAGAASG